MCCKNGKYVAKIPTPSAEYVEKLDEVKDSCAANSLFAMSSICCDRASLRITGKVKSFKVQGRVTNIISDARKKRTSILVYDTNWSEHIELFSNEETKDAKLTGDAILEFYR